MYSLIVRFEADAYYVHQSDNFTSGTNSGKLRVPDDCGLTYFFLFFDLFIGPNSLVRNTLFLSSVPYLPVVIMQ